MRQSTKLLGVVCSLMAIAVSACARDGQVSVRAAGTPTGATTGPKTEGITTPRDLQLAHGDWVLSGINALAGAADAGVIAEVLTVSAARYNSPDGQSWELGPENIRNLASPTVYRDVTLIVNEVIFSSDAVPVAAGREIIIRSYGDGTVDDGDVVMMDFPDGTVLHVDQRDGILRPGTKALLLLVRSAATATAPGPVLSDGQPDPYIQIVAGFEGNWTVDGEMAVSIDARRSAPLKELVNQILYERTLGFDFTRDETTKIDPLAGDPPPAEWAPIAVPAPTSPGGLTTR